MQIARFADPLWWRFQIQRRVADPDLRRAKADRIASRLPQRDLDQEIGNDLERDGFIMLPPVVTASLRAYFEERTVTDPYRPELGTFRFDAPPGESHIGHYAEEVVARAPGVLDIANDPDVLRLVTAHIGGCPTVAAISAWWSFPASTPAEHAELWHRDVDDYRFIKLFIYLTDVDEDSGPHCFIRGSHQIPRLTEVGRRIPDDEALDAFGRDRMVRFTGPAGTRFLENTYGVHHGYPPRERPRLVFQVLYAQRPLIYSPRKSYGIPGHDPWINRLYH